MFTSYLSVVFIFIGLNFKVEQIFCGQCSGNPKVCECESPPNITKGVVTTDKKTANYTCNEGFYLDQADSTIYCVQFHPSNITWNTTNLPSCIPSSSSQFVTTSVQTNRSSTTTAAPGTTLSNKKDNSNTVVYVAVPLVVVICILIGLLILGWRKHRIKSGHKKVKFHNEAGTGAIVSITNNSYGGENIISTGPLTDGNIAGSEYAEINLAEGPNIRGQEDQANEYQMIADVVEESKHPSVQPPSYSHSGQKQLASSRNAYSHFNSESRINSINADYAKVKNKQEQVVDDLPAQSPGNSYDKIGKTSVSTDLDGVKHEPDLTEPASDYSHLHSGETTAGRQPLSDQPDEYTHLNYRKNMAKSDATEPYTAKDDAFRDESSSGLKQNSSNPGNSGYETPVGFRHEYLEIQATWQNAHEGSNRKTGPGPGSDMPPQKICDGFQYQSAKDIGSVADIDNIMNESEMNSKLEETENNESHDYFVLEKTF